QWPGRWRLVAMRVSGTALKPFATSYVHLGRNEIAFLDAGHLIAVGDHLAAELVSGNERGANAVLRPAIPVIDVKVGSADRGDLDFDQDIGPPKAWNFDFAHFSAWGSC